MTILLLMLSVLKLILAILVLYFLSGSTLSVIFGNKEFFDKNLKLKNKVIINILIKLLILVLLAYMAWGARYSGVGFGSNFPIYIFGTLAVILSIIFKIHDFSYARKLKKKIKKY